ncbi:MAG: PEP/pyruvate-binding domain-containing protein [Elusimicrobia bacterium]|nr:PEP/pyruvate-binding domain-containing protein [Elusimicrobiota bacterium]
MRDHLLWDLNRAIRTVSHEAPEKELIGFIDNIFAILGKLKAGHATTVLDSLLALGREIYSTNDRAKIGYFIDKLIGLGFIPPGPIGIDEEWQVRVDPSHIKNIRVWLELIGMNTALSVKLISALIVNLKTGGIFISDTDLFQRDVSRLLNSEIRPVFELVKQLARIFPVYFNEIGAEGELRDITTQMDELSRREDTLVHFLRKQIHAESNNTHLELVRHAARYWYDGSVARLAPGLPEDVKGDLTASGKWYDGVHGLMRRLCAAFAATPEMLLEGDYAQIEKRVMAEPGASGPDKKRLLSLIRLYELLKGKYTFDAGVVLPQLQRASFLGPESIEPFRCALRQGDPEEIIEHCMRLMARLKDRILDPEKCEGDEDIYYKRHIAAGIPSMYGTYREPKFESLGLLFRLELMTSRQMEKLMRGVNLDFVCRSTLRKVTEILHLCSRGLEIDGISHEGFKSNLKMLEYSLTTSAFSIHRYINLFQFLAHNVRDIINEYFFDYHEGCLATILSQQMGAGTAGAKADEESARAASRLVDMRSEEFYRDMLSQAFLIQQLDDFLGRVLHALDNMAQRLPPDAIRTVMNYNPENLISALDRATPKVDNQIFLSAKGYFLKKMVSYGFPVPHGFIISTELFRLHPIMSSFPELEKEADAQIRAHLAELERKTGREYGNPENILLLSVRSGAAISLPGAMNTFLNVGMNDAIVEALSRQPNYGFTSWDCYRRFLQSWGMAHGISRDEFDEVIIRYKRLYNVREKVQFKPEQMREIAFAYKKVIHGHDVHFEDDPFRQLRQAVSFILDSWDLERARAYRRHLSIAEDWGTAVVIQQMVLGNINYDSGTGVVFTKDPHIMSPGVAIYGDFTMCSQGEDVVGGLVHPLPVSEAQRGRSPSHKGISLEKDFPEIYGALLSRARELVETHGYNNQELEFTFETSRGRDLYILQTRDQSIQRTRKAVFNDPALKENLVGSGIGIGGGAMNGRVAFSRDDLDRLAQEYPGEKRILIRPDTVPDDIEMIAACDGLLTARGGVTSHAAVTAVRLGKTCVVNCVALKVREKSSQCSIHGTEFKFGDKIAIDGCMSNIYRGNFSITIEEPA